LFIMGFCISWNGPATNKYAFQLIISLDFHVRLPTAFAFFILESYNQLITWYWNKISAQTWFQICQSPRLWLKQRSERWKIRVSQTLNCWKNPLFINSEFNNNNLFWKITYKL
jgi:hypothetical protein